MTSFELESSPRTPGLRIQDFGDNEMSPERRGNSEQHEASGLEPTDGGPSAWKLLFGAFLFEAILWGIQPFSLLP
jgi:hypothetical protein